MDLRNYNNIGIFLVGIHSVLSISQNLSLGKVLLIAPIFSSDGLTKYLARKTVIINSVEQLMGLQTHYFSNFNDRYYDSLSLSINSIQLLQELEYISIEQNGSVRLLTQFKYHEEMGDRANYIYKASQNVANLLKESCEKLHLTLRIEL